MKYVCSSTLVFRPPPPPNTHMYVFGLLPPPTYDGYKEFSCHHYLTHNAFKYFSKKSYETLNQLKNITK